MDKTGRNGLRVGDILAKDFKDRFNALKEKHKIFLKQFDFQYNTEEHEKEWMDAVNYLKKFQIVDSEYELNKYLKTKNALAEGAQGTLLDVDFGAYPFVTSSSTICAGACTALDFPLLRLERFTEFSKRTAQELARVLSLQNCLTKQEKS